MQTTKLEIKKPKLQEKLDLKSGINHTIKQIDRLLPDKKQILVGIAGGTASGKTSEVASKINENYPKNSLLLSMDNYYQGKTFMNDQAQKGKNLNWDQPEALNLELLANHLQQLHSNQPIKQPIYDMQTSEPTGSTLIQPKQIIILEGLFALNQKIKNQLNIKCFVDIGTHGRMIRRLMRDIKRTGQKPADILRYFSQTVEPMHELYVKNTKDYADIVINNEFNPQIESQKSGLHEIQLKFPTNLNTKDLAKIGIEKINEISHLDDYYNPGDRNLINTGEMLRLRREQGNIIFTYKGTINPQEIFYRHRPVFEFEIDQETANLFTHIYGDKIKTIIKHRTEFELDDISFCLDKVSKIEKGHTTYLGRWLEVRSQNQTIDQNKLTQALSKFNLKPEQGRKESYFEM